MRNHRGDGAEEHAQANHHQQYRRSGRGDITGTMSPKATVESVVMVWNG